MQYTVNELLKGAQKMAQSVFGKKDEYRLKFCKEEDDAGTSISQAGRLTITTCSW